jgi:2-polyprenyl-6-hydroxyphenyl methylase/3-demethylubiquinone-9 3-methyltransferase
MRTLLAIRDALEVNPTTVLEVAGGGGGVAATLAREGCRVTINDLRGEHTRTALEEYTTGHRVTLVDGDLFALDVERLGCFDLVIAAEIIEHVAHPDALLRHLKRFLEPGGRLLVTTPNGSYFRNRLPTYAEIENFTELEARQFKPDADGHLFLLTPDELSRLARQSGLHVERLGVWGTPLISGHLGLRIFRTKYLAWLAYQVERVVQRLSPRARERLCAGMTAVLTNPS